MNQEGRLVLLCGEETQFLVSSSGGRFIRCYSDPDGRWSEYLLHTPDELHETASGECVTVCFQDGMLVGFYEGELFANDIFIFEGGI